MIKYIEYSIFILSVMVMYLLQSKTTMYMNKYIYLGMGIEEERNTRISVRSVMSLYEGAKTRVGVDSELSEEFEVKLGMHHGIIQIGCAK